MIQNRISITKIKNNKKTTTISKKKVKKELEDPYLFKNRRLTKTTSRSIQRNIKQLGLDTLERLKSLNTPKHEVDTISLNNLHPHLFRKYYASTMLNEVKLDLDKVSELLGHENLETTQIYVKTDKETRERVMKEAVRKLKEKRELEQRL